MKNNEWKVVGQSYIVDKLSKNIEEVELYHFQRKCNNCGYEWGGLHCEHELVQNPCAKCNTRPIPIEKECNCIFDI